MASRSIRDRSGDAASPLAPIGGIELPTSPVAPVGSRAAVQGVRSDSTGQAIVPSVAPEIVVPCAAQDDVSVGAPEQAVVAVPSPDPVDTFTAEDVIGVVSADEHVVIASALEQIVPITAFEGVVGDPRMMSSPGVPDSRDYPETGGGLAYAAGEVVATNAIAASPTMSPNVLLRVADVVRPIVGVGTQTSSGGFIDHFRTAPGRQ